MKNNYSILVVKFKETDWIECFGSLRAAHSFLSSQFGIRINLREIYALHMTTDNDVRWENEDVVIFKRPLHTNKQKKY